jgi:hypothetical protein
MQTITDCRLDDIWLGLVSVTIQEHMIPVP